MPMSRMVTSLSGQDDARPVEELAVQALGPVFQCIGHLIGPLAAFFRCHVPTQITQHLHHIGGDEIVQTGCPLLAGRLQDGAAHQLLVRQLKLLLFADVGAGDHHAGDEFHLAQIVAHLVVFILFDEIALLIELIVRARHQGQFHGLFVGLGLFQRLEGLGIGG